MGHIEEVAARLKGLREALGLSVADVCAACGIEEEKYTAYEHGTTGIPVSTAKRIAEAYGVEIMALLFGEEPKMNSYYITRSPSTIPADLEEELLADCSYGLQGDDHGRHDDDGQEDIK